MANNAEFMHQIASNSLPTSRFTPDFLTFMREEINRTLDQQRIVFTMPGNGGTIIVDRSIRHANV